MSDPKRTKRITIGNKEALHKFRHTAATCFDTVEATKAQLDAGRTDRLSCVSCGADDTDDRGRALSYQHRDLMGLLTLLLIRRGFSSSILVQASAVYIAFPVPRARAYELRLRSSIGPCSVLFSASQCSIYSAMSCGTGRSAMALASTLASKALTKASRLPYS